MQISAAALVPLLEKMADKKADAVKAKTEGNKHFKAKNYEKAIESYTKAVELDPDKVIIGVLRESFPSTKVLKPPYFFQDEYFSNRANIYLAMEKWEEAEKDANKALELGKDNGKEYDRRAQARVGLKRYKSALADFKKAKELDPKTKNVDKNITETEKKMADEEASEKKAAEAVEEKVEAAADESPKDAEEGKTEAEASPAKADEAQDTKDETKETKEEHTVSDDKEKTDEELLLEIEARKAELERRLQAKVEAEAEEEMKEMIRERVLQKERKRLEKEKEAFRKMVKRFEEEERRRNGEVVSDDERKDSGLGSYSDHAEVVLETRIRKKV